MWKLCVQAEISNSLMRKNAVFGKKVALQIILYKAQLPVLSDSEDLHGMQAKTPKAMKIREYSDIIVTADL